MLNKEKIRYHMYQEAINMLQEEEDMDKEDFMDEFLSIKNIEKIVSWGKENADDGEDGNGIMGDPEEYIKDMGKILARTLFDYDNNINSTLIGIELEYGGYGDTFHSPIVETYKIDGSVSGSGREYNLKPVSLEELNEQAFHTRLERFMIGNIGNELRVDASAGMHVHVSADGLDGGDGATIYRIFETVFYGTRWYDEEYKEITYNAIHDCIEDEREVDDIEDCYLDEDDYEHYDDDCYKYLWSSRKAMITNQAKIDKLPARNKVMLNWIRCLYATSNRGGFEQYGMLDNGTRGWTPHETIELRVWRSTLDYRAVIGRAKFAVFWINHVLKYTRLADWGFIKWEEIPDIFAEIRKNEEIKNAYMYLVFNHKNHLDTGGYTRRDLCGLLNCWEKQASAIAQRSLFIEEGITDGDKAFAKQLFKKI